MMEVDEEEDDPIPNELDNALVHLIPAIAACGSDPALPSYLDLETFEKLAGPALRAGDGDNGGGSGDNSSSGRRQLDKRIAGEIEVAFRHCMHEAGMALVDAGADVGGAAAAGGRGAAGRARKGKKEAAAAAAGLQTEAEAMAETMSGPLGILSLALNFVSKEIELNRGGGGGAESVLSGLPLLLLEDFFESQVKVKAWEGGEKSQGGGREGRERKEGAFSGRLCLCALVAWLDLAWCVGRGPLQGQVRSDRPGG